MQRFVRWAAVLGMVVVGAGSPGVASAQQQRPSKHESGSSRPAITGIAFMQVYTTHPTEAERFYGRTMGLAEGHLAGDTVFAINHAQWVQVRPTTTPPEANARLIAIGFTTADVAGLQRYLEAHGVTADTPQQAGSFSVRDPEGNQVVFVQRGRSVAGQMVEHMQSLPSATSHRMIHVGFLVRDRTKEDAFWRDLLGFRPYWHGSAKDGTADDYVSLQVPDGTDWLEYMLNQPAHPDLRLTGVMDHFSLGVDHMQSVLAQLQANGCEGHDCTSIQAGRDGKVQLNLYDPDDTRVEYMEFQPAMKPCCSAFTGRHPAASDPE